VITSEEFEFGMSDLEQRERALREADRMNILASQYRQLGFKELARYLKKNAENALKWAARKQDN